MKLFRILRENDTIDDAIFSIGLAKHARSGDIAFFLSLPKLCTLESRFTYRLPRVETLPDVPDSILQKASELPKEKVSNLDV